MKILMTEAEIKENRISRFNLLFDLSKHITTLSAGTLLLLAGLFDKVFQAPVWKPLVAGSVICFSSTIVLSVWAMFGFALYSHENFRTENDPTEFGVNFFAVAMVMFMFGVTSFTAFAFRNLG